VSTTVKSAITVKADYYNEDEAIRNFAEHTADMLDETKGNASHFHAEATKDRYGHTVIVGRFIVTETRNRS